MSPMYSVEEKEVLINVVSPTTGEDLGTRKEFVSVRHDVIPSEEVRKDISEMYDIETQNRLGLQPVMLQGSYIHDTESAFNSVESVSSKMLDEIDRQEYAKSLEGSNETPTQTPTQTTE